MARKKSYPLTERPVWYAPSQKYEVVQREEIDINKSSKSKIALKKTPTLEAFGQISKNQYRLDIPVEQARLLDSYIQIADTKEAIAWVRENGLPAHRYNENGLRSSEKLEIIIESAKSLKELLFIDARLKDAERSNDSTSILELLEEQSSKYLWQLELQKLVDRRNPKDIAWYAEYTKLKKASLWDYFTYIKNRGQTNEHLTLSQRAFLREKEILEKEYASLISVSFKFNTKMFFAEKDSLQQHYTSNMDGTHLSRTYNKEVWQKNKIDWCFVFGRVYLAEAATILLKGVEPIYEVLQDIDGNWITLPSFAIHCPWQAMAMEFARRIADRPVKTDLCANPKCRVPLIGRRKDARVCEKPSCRRYSSRRLKPIRKYARETIIA